MSQIDMIPHLVVIKGAGDLATGVAHRLWYSGFDVVMLELPRPLVVRRTVSFATAVFEGRASVEGVTARLCSALVDIRSCLDQRIIPVIIDAEGQSLEKLKALILVDAIMAKSQSKSRVEDAELVIGLGPGFQAGREAHVVVETKRGHDLGRVIYKGSAIANTGEPGEIGGYGAERLLRAPADGRFNPLLDIGKLVRAGEKVALVGNTAVTASIGGLIRGLLYPGLDVHAGMKIGDIDPRGAAVDYMTISDKARAIGGGVLEAIMHHYFHPDRK